MTVSTITKTTVTEEKKILPCDYAIDIENLIGKKKKCDNSQCHTRKIYTFFLTRPFSQVPNQNNQLSFKNNAQHTLYRKNCRLVRVAAVNLIDLRISPSGIPDSDRKNPNKFSIPEPLYWIKARQIDIAETGELDNDSDIVNT